MFHRILLLREHRSIIRRNGIISTSQGLLLMMVKGTNMGPTVVSFALAGAETNVFIFFAFGILPIAHAIYRRKSIIVISSRFLARVVPGRYVIMFGN